MGYLVCTKQLGTLVNNDTKIVMIGLDGAGKTTILFKMKIGEIVTTIPTIGFNVETVVYKKINFTVWDIGGQDKIRPLWKHYYQNVHGVILVIDSNDKDRIVEVNEELKKILEEDELKDAVILIFANKQDLPNSLCVSEIIEKLSLNSIKSRQWNVQPTCATTGKGLFEGLDWLAKVIKR